MSNLTKTFIERLPHPDKGQQAFYRDEKVEGLAVRVTHNSKTFVFERRFRKQTVRVSIGSCRAWSVDDARKRAAELDVKMDQGIDPRQEKLDAQRRSKTLREVFDAFMESRQLKERTRQDYKRYFDVYLGGTWEQKQRHNKAKEPRRNWHDIPVTEIDAEMIATRHLEIARSRAGEEQANACMRVLRAVLNWAQGDLGESVLPKNAADVLKVKRQWFREAARQKYIKSHELQPWFAAVNALREDKASADRETIAAFLEFVLLTGARRGEAARLQWTDVDFRDGSVVFRDTKSHEDRTIPMTRHVRRLLETLQERKSNDYVFAATSGETGYIQEPRKALAAVTRASGVKHTFHDLRRTYATHLEGLDVSAAAVKRLLGHSDGRDVTMRHYIGTDLERLRRAAQTLEDYILREAGLIPSAEVTQLRPSVAA